MTGRARRRRGPSLATTLRSACLVALLGAAAPGDAADTPLAFEDPVRQARYETLLEELRCLVCQNQSLADSHAELAQDMRAEVHRLLAEGRSDAAVTDWLVERYGDFVLYRPPVKHTTWLLWAGPFVLLAIAGVIVLRAGARRAPPPAPLSAAERARVAALERDLADREP